jgi:formylglycine-generating enzyme required for sulfatase activity
LADRLEHGVPLTLNPGRAAGATMAELKKLYSAGVITVDEIGEAERIFSNREGDAELRKLYRDLAAGVLTPEYFRQFRQLLRTRAAAAPAAEEGTRKVDVDPEAEWLAEAAAFDAAKALDTEGSWEQFIIRFPNSLRIDEARRRIAALRATAERQRLEQAAYIFAESQNTEQGWESFIERYSTSQLAVVARNRLEVLRKARLERESSLYAKAVASDAPDDWDRLLKEFPSGRFAEEAAKKKVEADRRLAEETTLEAARKADTLDSWKAYLDKYPGGAGAPEAKVRLERLTWLAEADLVAVPAGSFMMGSQKGGDDARPEHRVEVAAFRMGRGEVTNGLYLKFAEDTKRRRPKDPGFGRNYLTANPRLPVVNVTHADAVAFCKWLSEKTGATVRLPTEAEWEYAALGGHDGYTYPWGSADPRSRARYGGNAPAGMKTVARDAFPPNDFGLHNLSGNVAEWVADYYADRAYVGGTKKNPTGPPTGRQRVIRGGSFESDATEIRVFRRDKTDPHAQESWLGFRIVVK